MFGRDFWREIWYTISKQKVRSLLTAFGVFWGTFMLVVVVGAFSGLNHGFMGLMSTMDYETLLMSPKLTTIPYKGMSNSREWTIKYDDLSVIEKRFHRNVRMCGGISMIPGKKRLASVDGKTGFAKIHCVMPSYFLPIPLKMTSGRFINDIDMLQKRRVCVIGANVAARLFGDGIDPCGQQLSVEQFSYTIVGVVKKTNSTVVVIDNEDDLVLLPFTTADAVYKLEGKCDVAYALMDMTSTLDRDEKELTAFVREMHNVSPDDDYAIELVSMQDYVKQWGLVFKGMNILTVVVGAGMLVAGIMGIFNIMLISIRERRQELGIRLSLGSNPHGIVWQVVCESLVLTLSAGFAGLLSGLGVITVMRRMVEYGMNGGGFLGIPQIPFGVTVASLVLMLIGGTLAGFLPASKVVENEVIDLLSKQE